MFEKVKKAVSLISLSVPIIYIIGFVIVNSYLSKFSIYDTEVLSLNYLKAGIFFTGILLIAVGGVFASFGIPTDKLSKNYHQYFILFHNCLFVCAVLGVILFSPFTKVDSPLIKHAPFLGIGLFSFFIYFTIRFIDRDNLNKSKRKIILINIILSVLLLVFLISMWQITPVLKPFVGFYIVASLLINLELSEYFDGEYDFVKIPLKVIGFAGLAIFFGYFIFGELPNYYSGPKTKFNELFLEDSLIINEKKLIKLSNKEIIYYGSSYYYISVDDSTILQLSANKIKSVTYRKRSKESSQH